MKSTQLVKFEFLIFIRMQALFRTRSLLLHVNDVAWLERSNSTRWKIHMPNIIYHSSCHFHFRAKAAAEETTIVDLKVEIAELKIALDSARSQGNV